MSQQTYPRDDDDTNRRFAGLWMLLLVPALALGWLGVDYLVEAPDAPASAAIESGPASTAKPLWAFAGTSPRGLAVQSKRTQFVAQDGKLLLLGDEAANGYQLSSEKLQLTAGRPHRLSWRLRAVRGQTAAGVLDVARDKWLAVIPIGQNEVSAEFTAPAGPVLIMIINANTREATIVEVGAASVVPL